MDYKEKIKELLDKVDDNNIDGLIRILSYEKGIIKMQESKKTRH